MAAQFEDDSKLRSDMPDSTAGVRRWEFAPPVEPGEVPFITLLVGDKDDSGDDDPDSPSDDRDYDEDHGGYDSHDNDAFPDDDYDDSVAHDSDEDV